MARHALTLASITLLASGCGHHAVSSPHVATTHAAAASVKVDHKPPATPAATVPASDTAPSELASSEQADGAAPLMAGAQRKLGDFHVYEYSGLFAKEPVTLTEQVVAREQVAGEPVLVVDFVLQEGEKMTAIRVRMRSSEEVVRVSQITGAGETDATIADYDAIMKKTAFVPDSNDEALGTEHTACLIGTEQVDCDISSYGVTIGTKQAKLSITRSANVPGRDLGGDVVASDGKLIYRARLVERGNQPPVVESFAKLDAPFVPQSP